MAGPLDLRGTATVNTGGATKSLHELAKGISAAATAGRDGARGMGQSFRDGERSIGGMIGQLSRWNAEAQKAQASSFSARMGSWQKDMAAGAASVNLSAWESAGRRAGDAFRRGMGKLRAFDEEHGIAAGTIIGSGLKAGGKKLFQEAGTVEQERKLWSIQSGLTPHDLAEMERKAEEVSRRYPQITKAAAMRAVGELRMPMADIHGAHHAMNFLPIGAQAHGILKNMTHLGKLQGVDADEAVFDLAKAGELRGFTTSAQFKHGTNQMLKSIIASGGKITALDWHMASKSMRGGLNYMGDDFLYSILPTFMQEFKAGGGTATQAGSGMLSFYRTLVGGRMTKTAIEKFLDMGLIDPEKVIRDSKGNPRALDAGAVYGTQIPKAPKWMTALGGGHAMLGKAVTQQYAVRRWNPLDYMQGTLLPALVAHGITDKNDQAQWVASAFSNQVSEHMAQMMINPGHVRRIMRDAQMIKGVGDMDEISEKLSNAPVQGMAEFKSQWTNLLAALGDPMIETAVAAMKKMASVFSELARVSQNSTAGAAGVGVGSLALAGGAAYGLGRLAMRTPIGRLLGGVGLGMGLGSGGSWLLNAALAQQVVRGTAGAAMFAPEVLAGGAGAAAGAAGMAGKLGWLGRLGGLAARATPWLYAASVAGGAGLGAWDAYQKGGGWGDVGKGALWGGFNSATLGLFGGSAEAAPAGAMSTVGVQAQDAQGQVSAATAGMAADLAALGPQMEAALSGIDLSGQGQRIMESLASGLRAGGASAVAAVEDVGHQIEAAASRIRLNTGPMMRGAD